MARNLSNIEFLMFQKYIKEKCCIDISDDKAYLIETRLSKMLADLSLQSYSELYSCITGDVAGEYTERIIDAITTNETMWFRDKTPWEILERFYLPRLIEELKSGKKKKIRIWSTASSTGQEAYSTAMCIDSYLREHAVLGVCLDDFEIVATDISNHVLEIAKNGKYDAISILRGLEGNVKSRYFQKKDRVWEICEKIRNAVSFRKFNLQESFLPLGTFDVIFCRYVMIYFSADFVEALAKKLWDALAMDGVLFLGAYELYEVMKRYFDSALHANGVYYTKKEYIG